ASALVASIPYARRAIPRLAAAAALLVILSAVLSWGGRAAPRATANESFAELLIAGSELGGDPWFESLTGAEDSR
ncbi:MAG TPA: hypothetical protein VD788_12085, partial [Candidatus Polarisedimenticolaceae bacterium]|nr:hypothetical protein [Candidatus Polarisedimenticolaceae bacterium]